MLRIFKETTVPGSLVANAMYLVAPAGRPNDLEIFVTDSAGTATRGTLTRAVVTQMINDAFGSGAGGVPNLVVADIAARNALTGMTVGQLVLVLNASADTTVTSGAATYVYRTGPTWTKISEAESMDVVLNWTAIVGRPTSTAAQIDAAVGASHAHTNKASLDKITEDAQGNLLYGGNLPYSRWASTNW